MYELILASQSPRRSDILKEWGYEFRSFPVEISEIPNKNLSLKEQICDLARQKAEAAAERLKDLKSEKKLILSADTMVLFENQVLGKPDSKDKAIETLGHLSGSKHEVVTAFCLWDLYNSQFETDFEVSYVEFHKLEKKQILDYVETGEPMDKAGSYGIQGEARKFVKSYSGSFENIVGLPIQKIEKAFADNGWDFGKKPKTHTEGN